MNIAIENHAIDFITNDDSYEINTKYEDFIKMKNTLEENNITEFIMNETRYIPINTITLEEEQKNKIYGIIETLEDFDDVTNVYHNMEE